jgi:hypothetical protein
LAAPCPPPPEGADSGASTHEPGETRKQDDQGEGRLEQEDRDERGGGNADHRLVLQRPSADARHGLEHDREHGGFPAEERRLHHAHLAEGGVDQA